MHDWIVERVTNVVDLEGVLEVDRASFVNGWPRQLYVKELQNTQVARIYVLRTPRDGVAAFCSCWLVFDELHINNLAVRPSCRGIGIGASILDHVLHEGARLGARRATLEMRRSNRAALRLYHRFGFEISGVRRGYYRDPEEDALILWHRDLEIACASE